MKIVANALTMAPVNALMILLGLGMFLNGVYMLVDPLSWYLIVPTVPGTGSFNQHFVRDIGISYLLVGAGYVYGVYFPAQRLWLWSSATLWLALHAVFHLWEIAVGICGAETIIQNGFAVHLPAVIGLVGVVWALRPPKAAE